MLVFQVARLGSREGMGEMTGKKFRAVDILLISAWFLSMETLFLTPTKWFNNLKIG